MKNQILFYTKNNAVTNIDFFNALQQIKADEADVLYIHTALNFGKPNRELKKSQLLECLYETLLSLGVSTLIFPAYTFSFCNGQDYDINDSKTPMGLFNEYVRVQKNAIRSIDPLMSNVLVGKHIEFVKNIGKFSAGENSTFDLLHKTDLKVKFLFIGPKIGDCFTHMHYIEDEQKVPYRYNRKFSGGINDGIKKYDDTYELFVRYSNVFPGGGSYVYENILLEKGICKKVNIGNGSISVIPEKPAYDSYVELLKMSPSFYITEPFDPAANTKDFEVKNMVSL